MLGAVDGTPHGKDYVLTVYQDEDGVLRQALSSESTTKLAPNIYASIMRNYVIFVPFIIRRQGAVIGWKITWIISLRK